MKKEQFCCYCPFCMSPKRPAMCTKNWKLSWSACFITLLLLLGSCEAYHIRVPRTSVEGTEIQVASSVSLYQKMSFSQKLNDNKPTDDHSCRGVGKCRPCSWLDMNRKVQACVKSGFKQRSYCTSIKKEKYTSCEYVPNSSEPRVFWLFEGSVWSVGILAYAVVTLRNRKIEQRTARRIQAQINA